MLYNNLAKAESIKTVRDQMNKKAPKARKRLSSAKEANVRNLLPGYRAENDSANVFMVHRTVSSLQPFGF